MPIARRIRVAAATALLAAAMATTLTGAAQQDRNCDDFEFQEDAQEAFAEAGEGDPFELDDNDDGIACETLPERPVTDTTPPTTSGEDLYQVGNEIAPGRYRTSGGTADCYWARLSADTGAAGAVIEFDVVSGEGSFTVLPTDAFIEFKGDCRWTFVEALPSPSISPSPSPTVSPSVAPSPSPTTTPVVDDKDCADFATQALAQAALAADRTDPDNLDADDDGIACEDRFGTDGQQVSVLPIGGVATGGLASP